jgi:AcrR family transcriptional regulator
MARRAAQRADTLPALAEVFREHGYEGASLALISKATGLGKGSLYNFYPGGKAEMAAAVLADIDGWFETQVFAPLLADPDPQRAVAAMFDAVSDYFRSGRRVCLVGALALGEARDRFAAPVRGYFAAWIEALATALVRSGRAPAAAVAIAEEAVAGVQGAIVLARALDRPKVFERMIGQLRERLDLRPVGRPAVDRTGETP